MSDIHSKPQGVPPKSPAPANSKIPAIPKGFFGKLLDNLQMMFVYAVLGILSPFIVDYFVTKWEKDLPSSWVRGWRKLRTSGLYLLALIVLAYIRSRATNEWAAFALDAIFLVVALRAIFRMLWELGLFVLLPKTPGITQLDGENFLDKIEKGLRDFLREARTKLFAEFKVDGAMSKVVSGLFGYGFDLGRKYLQEILVRGTLVYLSLQYALLLVFSVLMFSSIYDWLGLVSPQSFAQTGAALTFGDFMFYSFDVLTTSSISGVTPATHLTKLVSAIELGMGFFSLVLFVPLIFVSYDRAIQMSHEERRTRETHMLKGLATFLEAKTGVPVDEALKLLAGELEAGPAELLGIKITRALDKDKAAKTKSS